MAEPSGVPRSVSQETAAEPINEVEALSDAAAVNGASANSNAKTLLIRVTLIPNAALSGRWPTSTQETPKHVPSVRSNAWLDSPTPIAGRLAVWSHSKDLDFRLRVAVENSKRKPSNREATNFRVSHNGMPVRSFGNFLDRSLYGSLIPSTQTGRLGFVVRDLLKVLSPGGRVIDDSQRKSASASR